jgi:hypothetical protein
MMRSGYCSCTLPSCQDKSHKHCFISKSGKKTFHINDTDAKQGALFSSCWTADLVQTPIRIVLFGYLALVVHLDIIFIHFTLSYRSTASHAST